VWISSHFYSSEHPSYSLTHNAGAVPEKVDFSELLGRTVQEPFKVQRSENVRDAPAPCSMNSTDRKEDGNLRPQYFSTVLKYRRSEMAQSEGKVRGRKLRRRTQASGNYEPENHLQELKEQMAAHRRLSW
jgi:hypothetical protein